MMAKQSIVYEFKGIDAGASDHFDIAADLASEISEALRKAAERMRGLQAPSKKQAEVGREIVNKINRLNRQTGTPR